VDTSISAVADHRMLHRRRLDAFDAVRNSYICRGHVGAGWCVELEKRVFSVQRLANLQLRGNGATESHLWNMEEVGGV
jgi:hypothetical protein